MGFMGLGGWEIVMLFAVVRAAAASGVRQAQRETEPTREDLQG